MIIDFHMHCYTDKLAARAMSVLQGRAEPFYDGTIKGLNESLKKTGIDAAVALNIANKPEHTQNVNDWAIAINREDGIYSFGSVHPFYADYKTEIERLKAAGIKGLKFHPYYQGYDVDDKAAYLVYEEAARQGMIMLFHVGLDILVPGQRGTSDKFARVIDDLKYDRIVAAHLGGSLTPQLAMQHIWGRDVYLDMSLSFRYLDDNQRQKLADTHGINKLLFGSDGPWAGPQPDFESIDAFFKAEEREKIYYANAANLLEL
jgi:predicted TIM-barrel fold metal-dependent hydrolase